MPKKRNMVPITDLPIFTYQPMQPGRKFLAKIGKLPMIFKGATEDIARSNADAWRHEEVAKEKAKRLQSAERAAAMKAARTSSKEQADA